VEAIKKMTPPRNKAEVTSLVCMLQSTGFGRDFITDLASKTKNIRRLLKKNSRFKWSDECHKEFLRIKKEFSKDILLRHYDPEKETYIEVDASREGLSALLLQGKDRKIVAVASRSTTETERCYPQLDLESLAIDYGLRRFRFYILGGPKVTVLTDHKPLKAIFSNTRKGSIRSDRIMLRHQDINYKVQWEKGQGNRAD